MTEEYLEWFIATKLSNRAWRLDNLYTIVDKNNVRGVMRLNHAQKIQYNVKHPKTITLKSRQRGISTYKVAEGLDRAIFYQDTQAGIQSYGLSESKKLYKKAMLMWNEFDPEIKELLGIVLTSANGEGLTFNNGSTLKIGNFRGDTLSDLHVSELAKIAKKFPEKAEELNTGAFEAVATNSRISIESTAEGSAGLFFEIWNRAVRRKLLVGEDNLTPLDFYPIFLSWLDDPDCNMDHHYESSEDDELYFKEVEKYWGVTLTQSQKNWCSAKRDRLGDEFNREYPYSPEAAFRMSVAGTYYKKQYDKLLKERRVKKVPYTPGYPVYAIFDLGMNDTMVIGYWQTVEGRPRLIGEYSNNGENIEFYVKIMREMPFRIDIVYLPHDGNVNELITGRTRLEEFQRLGCTCRILPRISLNDGINAARQMLLVMEMDESCEDTLNAIQMYRQKYDKRLQVFLGIPEHDVFSHHADMVRYAALALGFYVVEASVTPNPKVEWDRIKSMSGNMAI